MRVQLREDQVMWQVVDDEVVVLDLRSSEYLSVNASGRLLWQRLLEGPATDDELVGVLTNAYDIADDVARADVHAFLADLRARELLQ